MSLDRDIDRILKSPENDFYPSEIRTLQQCKELVGDWERLSAWLTGILTAPPDTTADEMREMANDAVILGHPWKRSVDQ